MTAIKPSLEKLQKFFRLEAERNYDDKSVMGGLANMLDGWEAEARQDQLPEEIIQAVIQRLRDYHRLSEDGRATALKGLWARVRKEMGLGDGQDDGGNGRPAQPQTTTPAAKPAPDATPPAPATPAKPAAEAAPKKAQAETQPKTAPPADAAPPKETKKAHVKKREDKPRPEGPPAAFSADVTVLDGVGQKNAEKLAKLGINNLGDMLYHFPRRYDDYTQMKTINRLRYGDKDVTVIGTVQSSAVRPLRGSSKLVEVIVSDGSGALRVTWFNQPWIAQSLPKGTHIVLSGNVEQYLGRLQMSNPEWEPLSEEQLHTNRIVPVYPLTAQISQRWLRGQMNKVVEYWAPRVIDTLPAEVRKNCDLMPLADALLQVHFPDSWEDLDDAGYRLAFDEIFLLQMGVVQQKRAWGERDGAVYEVPDSWLEAQTARLPYELTGAQQKAISDLRRDLSSGHPMNRLLQGDVGSGKTVVAALGLGMVLELGKQTAVLAPTSILAEQHFRSLSELLTGDGGLLQAAEIRLLIGATPESEKAEIRAGLADGSIRLVVGTHALLEEPVQFKELQMAVIDEQHRFGVEQRAALRQKGENPHLLVMSATPIPRSLSLTIYGDLDLTVMDEMPPGREPVSTHVLLSREIERGYRLIEREVAEGRQAFIIYPMVEEREESDTDDGSRRAAVEEQQRLQEIVFPTHRVGLVHGRMTPAEKEEAMAQFRDGAIDILVSTTVIEVGVDVPNANVMIVEGANRFGLAQLHQLRGRVGRGGGKAFCLLVPEHDDAAENERLTAMVESNDGFYLAEKDLELRGPGDFLGTRQAGFGTLQLASMTDVRLIEQARNEAQRVLETDPDLQNPDHMRLAESMKRFWQSSAGELS